MALFHYVAKDGEGRVVRGTSEAGCEEALVRRLRERGFYVQKVSAAEAAEPGHEASVDPIEHVLAVILNEALKPGCARAEIELLEDEGGKKSVTVYVTAGDERHPMMSVPHYVWPPLLKAVCEKAAAPVPQAGSESGGYFQFEAHGKSAGVSFTASTTRISLEVLPTSG